MRAAIVGTGSWAATALVPALRARGDVEIVACVGANLDEGRRFAAEHGIGGAYGTLHEMIAVARLDVAVVATPDHLHAEAVRALMDAGIAVYCEKPLSNDARTAHGLVALQRTKKVPATVGYSFRFNPAVQALKADLDAGLFGDIWLIELAEHNPQFHPRGGKPLNWKGDPSQAAGGALFEYGSHVIDMGAWLLGPVARVSSSFKRVLPGARLDDIATLQLDFAGGARVRRVNLCGRGAFFGELAFLDRGAHSTDAIAANDVEVFALSREGFDAFAEMHKMAALNLFGGLASVLTNRVRFLTAELVSLES